LVGLLVISIAGAFAGTASSFSWGGAAGELMNAWLVKWIGSFGTGAVLCISIFAYIIWRFNPTFKWPERKIKPAVTKEAVEEDALVTEEAEPNNEAKLFIDDNLEVPVSNNKLKNDGKAVTVVMPEANEQDALPQFDVKEIEEEHTNLVAEEPGLTDEPMPLTINEKLGAQIASGALDLEIEQTIDDRPQTIEEVKDDTTLEIKQTVEDDVIEEEPIVDEPETETEPDNTGLEIRSDELATVNYDPTLDLRDYKYPELTLLETHGSEKLFTTPQN